MGTKEMHAGRNTITKRHHSGHLHGLIREATNLDDLDSDVHTEISDFEAAERTSKYIVAEMQRRLITVR